MVRVVLFFMNMCSLLSSVVFLVKCFMRMYLVFFSIVLMLVKFFLVLMKCVVLFFGIRVGLLNSVLVSVLRLVFRVIWFLVWCFCL